MVGFAIYAISLITMIFGLIIAEMVPIICSIFVDYDSFNESKQIVLISVFIILVYSMFFVVQLIAEKMYIYIIFAGLMLLEVFVNSFYSITYDLSEAGLYDKTIECFDAINLNNNKNTLFYRSKLLGTGVTNSNYIIGLKGMSSYNSMINNDILSFILFIR